MVRILSSKSIQTSPDLPRIAINQDIAPWRVICLSGAALRGYKSGGHKILDAWQWKVVSSTTELNFSHRNISSLGIWTGMEKYPGRN
jgi:hypothetical protein